MPTVVHGRVERCAHTEQRLAWQLLLLKVRVKRRCSSLLQFGLNPESPGSLQCDWNCHSSANTNKQRVNIKHSPAIVACFEFMATLRIWSRISNNELLRLELVLHVKLYNWNRIWQTVHARSSVTTPCSWKCWWSRGACIQRAYKAPVAPGCW
jgi:hypothetical protein